MKTLANCTPKEFAVQTAKIAGRIKNYSDGIKKITKSVESGERDIFNIISYVCDGNVDETMEICGSLCFMSGEEFANLDPEKGEDGILALVDIINSVRCIRFFATLLQLQKVIKPQ